MNPSPSAITWIKTLDTNHFVDPATVAASINATMVANPVAQGQVPNPISEGALIGVLPQASQTALLNWVNLGLVKADVDAQNRPGLLLWSMKLELAGVISAADAGALTQYLGGSQADPAWTAQIPTSMANLGRLVDAGDISAARSN